MCDEDGLYMELQPIISRGWKCLLDILRLGFVEIVVKIYSDDAGRSIIGLSGLQKRLSDFKKEHMILFALILVMHTGLGIGHRGCLVD